MFERTHCLSLRLSWRCPAFQGFNKRTDIAHTLYEFSGSRPSWFGAPCTCLPGPQVPKADRTVEIQTQIQILPAKQSMREPKRLPFVLPHSCSQDCFVISRLIHGPDEQDVHLPDNIAPRSNSPKPAATAQPSSKTAGHGVLQRHARTRALSSPLRTSPVPTKRCIAAVAARPTCAACMCSCTLRPKSDP